MAILGYQNRSPCIRAFGLEEWLKQRGLAGWLEIATDGLEPPDKERITNEIGAHYAEAVSTHMAAGEPERSAQAAALAELGDPTTAALNFRKSHLTEREAKWMQSMERTASKPFFSFRTLPLDIMPLLGFALLFSHIHHIPNSRFLAIPVIVAFAGFRLIPRLIWAKALPRASFLRGLALSNFLTGAGFNLAYVLILITPPLDVFDMFFIFYIGILYFIGPAFRIWNKLRKMGGERNDLPPQKTPAS